MGTPLARNRGIVYGIKYYADPLVSGSGAGPLLSGAAPDKMGIFAGCKPDFLCKRIHKDAAFAGWISLLVMVCGRQASRSRDERRKERLAAVGHPASSWRSFCI